MSSTNTIIEESKDRRYKKFDSLIGTGTFKKVYLAFDSVEGRDVAWSDISLEGVTSEEINQFSNEVKLLRSVNSEYIIHYYDSWYDQEKNRLIIITQCMPSGTILEYIKNKVVSMEAIKKWSLQILEGLAYLHAQKPPIIHKDLKCSNLFIDGVMSTIRIGDLGLASRIDKESTIAGTLEYMAPEIIDNNTYNEKTDMYAFGMCLLELVTRKPPYSECEGTMELLSKIMSRTPPDGLSEVSDPSIKNLILRLIGSAELRPTAVELLHSPILLPLQEDPASHASSPASLASPDVPQTPQLATQPVTQLATQPPTQPVTQSPSHSPTQPTTQPPTQPLTPPAEATAVSPQAPQLPQKYPRLVLQLSSSADQAADDESKEPKDAADATEAADTTDAADAKDLLVVNWLSNEQNVIKLSVIRQYSSPAKKPIKLIVPFVYGVDCVEGLVSLLVTLHIITEVVVEQTAQAIRLWLSVNVANEIREGCGA